MSAWPSERPFRLASSLVLLAALSACGHAPGPRAPASSPASLPPASPKPDDAPTPCADCTEANRTVWGPVEAQLLAYNAHDLDRFVAAYAPSVEAGPLEGPAELRGHEAMRAEYAPVFAPGGPAPRAKITARFVSGDHVVDHETVTLRLAGRTRTVDASVTYRVHEGKIDRVWFSPPHFREGDALSTAVVHGTVLRPERTGDGAVIEDAVVVMEDGKIKAIGPATTVRVPEGADVVDARGKWITAGLVDTHVHFFQSGSPYARPDTLDATATHPYAAEMARTKERLPRTFRSWLASGVTTVADDGGPFWNFEVRDAARHSREAPRVKVAGPLIATRDDPSVHRMDLDDPPIFPVKNAAEARALAAREVALAPDFVKVWFLHEKGDDLHAQEAIAKAAADVAHAHHVPVMVHATELEVAKAALRAGADILVHSIDDALIDDELVGLARARRVSYVPTLYVDHGYDQTFFGPWRATPAERTLADPEIVKELETLPREALPKALLARRNEVAARLARRTEVRAKNLVRMRDAGVRIALGTDAGNIGTVHGPSIFREMKMMHEAGMTPAQVLVAATSAGAATLGMEEELGLEAGRAADLLIFSHDPRVTVPDHTDIAWVVARGRPHVPTDLIAHE